MNPKPYILLADDNPDDQTFIRDAFKYIQAKESLRIVDSGRELLEYLSIIKDEDPPQLIVLDYNMPEMDGAEVLQEIVKQEQYKNIPIIMLSTSFYKKHIDHCLQMGADGYLIKPDNFFDWEKLAHKMLEYTRHPKGRKVSEKQ